MVKNSAGRAFSLFFFDIYIYLNVFSSKIIFLSSYYFFFKKIRPADTGIRKARCNMVIFHNMFLRLCRQGQGSAWTRQPLAIETGVNRLLLLILFWAHRPTLILWGLWDGRGLQFLRKSQSYNIGIS